jgi:porin
MAHACLSATVVRAAERNESPPPASFLNPQADRLTGDWGGLRTELEEQGLKFSLFTNVFYGANAKGGLTTNGAQRVSQSSDLFLQMDFEKMRWIEGGELLLHVKDNYGDNINPLTGAISHPIDDADGNRNLYVDQLWYQQDLSGQQLQLRLGYLDQQTMLDRNAYANSEDKQFMSTYLDNNNAIIPLAIGLGASLFVNPTDWLSFVIGGADAEADPRSSGFGTTFNSDRDFFGFFQSDFKFHLSSEKGDLPGNYRFGVIFDPRDKTQFDNPTRTDNTDAGFYTSFDQLLCREDADSTQGLGWFARYGHRHDDVNKISDFYSSGFQYMGLLEGRGRDTTGLAMYRVESSDDYRRFVNPSFHGETGYELYYRIQMTPCMALTPDVQYVHQPGGLKNGDDALGLAMRLRITF